MQRIGQRARLREGCKEEYERWHRQVWPEVLEALRGAGISNYSIFRRGRDLFAYFEVKDLETALASMEGNATCERWQEKMNQFMETDDEGKPWEDMSQIFCLE